MSSTKIAKTPTTVPVCHGCAESFWAAGTFHRRSCWGRGSQPGVWAPGRGLRVVVWAQVLGVQGLRPRG